MKSRLLSCAFVAALSTFTVVACTATAPKEILEVPANTFNNQSRYAILWIKPCNGKALGGCEDDDGRTTEAKLAIHGSPDRIDLKQQYEDEVGLSASIARVNATTTIDKNFLRDFKDTLSARGLDIVAVANPVYEGALRKKGSTTVSFADAPRLTATQFPLQVKSNRYDFAPLYENLGVDYLLVLELLNFTVDRHYGPTGNPVSNPQVVSALRVYLHEGATDELLFNDFSYDFALSDDEWDSPPMYQSLSNLLVKTLEKSVAKSKANLMKLAL